MLDRTQTVAQIVLAHPSTAPVFQRHRIDFCCGGAVTVEAACQEKGIDAETVRRELEQALAHSKGGHIDAASLSTPALVAHIIGRHHEYLRRTLPSVQALASKVARVHGDKNDNLGKLDAHVQQLVEALEPHLEQEERVLFPALMSGAPSEVVRRELSSMHQDHLAVGKLLVSIREATEDFSIPFFACNSYRALFRQLEEMESDIHHHVHLENHVLMPRFADA